MFSGIVQTVGYVVCVSGDCIKHLQIKTTLADQCRIGDSVSINGVCLTVTERVDDVLYFDVITETLSKTNLGALCEQSPVNIELSLRYKDYIGGHLMQGHVDGVGVINDIINMKDEKQITITVSQKLSTHMITKGFISIDGMSLTIVNCSETELTIALIPHTLSHTIAQHYRSGSTVNIEVDMMSKYIQKHIREVMHANA